MWVVKRIEYSTYYFLRKDCGFIIFHHLLSCTLSYKTANNVVTNSSNNARSCPVRFQFRPYTLQKSSVPDPCVCVCQMNCVYGKLRMYWCVFGTRISRQYHNFNFYFVSERQYISSWGKEHAQSLNSLPQSNTQYYYLCVVSHIYIEII